MNAKHAQLRTAPITSGLTPSNPKILLGGSHQPSLLRYTEGWPRRHRKSRALLIQFASADESLARFATDSFDGRDPGRRQQSARKNACVS